MIYHVAIGVGALAQNQGDGNIAIGDYALYSNISGNRNVSIGGGSAGNLVGFGNTTVGSGASVGGSPPYYGSGGIAIGSSADIVIGSGNIAIGVDTTIGMRALPRQDPTWVETTTVIGNGARAVSAFQGVPLTNATAIGAGAFVNRSNKVRLGNDAVWAVETHGDFRSTGPGNGLSLVSPNGMVCRRLSIDNSGNLVLVPVDC
jgi:hypothetical protein